MKIGWMIWMAFLFLFAAAGVEAGDGSAGFRKSLPVRSGMLTDV
jgi:hypothetical protein